MKVKSSIQEYLKSLLIRLKNLQCIKLSPYKQNNLDDLLENLISVLSIDCFCAPSQQTIRRLKNALNAILSWSILAPISFSLKADLQAALSSLKNQLQSEHFSCCATIKAFQVLELVLIKIINQPLGGSRNKYKLQILLQQLQGIITQYLICITCELGPTESLLYISNRGDNTVKIFDLNKNTIIDSVSGFNDPNEIAISSDNSKAYIADSLNDRIVILDLTTSDIINTISGFVLPEGIVLSSDGANAYVPNADTISIVDLNTNTITANINVYEFPSSIAVTSDNSKAYIPQYSLQDGTFITILNLNTNTISDIISGLPEAIMNGIAITSNDSIAYVAASTAGKVFIIDLNTKELIGSISGFSFPSAIAITSDDSTAYVTNFQNSTVSIVDLNAGVITGSISGFSQPFGIAIK
ncbi:YncE family protein [Bacillus thuringiensis]|uniref:YncE family protein n=1 Tax=Bacillus thuringiensis TaxID=1428 RepID=UPI000BFE7079|nr:YncE family protein [Bacillus thuringiensis]PGQ23097.1 hypothetical protein COA11_26615 [Bacillus thuringiensis]